MRRFLGYFRRLQWKLTLTYTLTTTLTLLLLECLVIGIGIWAFTAYNSPILENGAQQLAGQMVPLLLEKTPDTASLHLLLLHSNFATASNLTSIQHGFITVVDSQGRVLTSVGERKQSPGTLLSTQLSSEDEQLLNGILLTTNDKKSVSRKETDGTILVLAPIEGGDKSVLGALVLKTDPINALSIALSGLPVLLPSALLFALIASIAGIIAGIITARSFVRRFKGLSAAADSWSRGNFTTFAQDTSADELGQLTRQLNRMAEQLQNLLQTRQQLATLEERNRLARDLHDSVKQQVFAISMQVAAAKMLLKRDLNAAEGRLSEAERLVKQSQQELTALIRELRPVALEGKGLAGALQELVANWRKETNIDATIKVKGTESVPLPMEEAFFRIAQEALSNVARHSKATAVQLLLQTKKESVRLVVSDNGCGFRPSTARQEGVGLRSMRERLEPFAGQVTIDSVPGKGTTVTASCQQAHIPL